MLGGIETQRLAEAVDGFVDASAFVQDGGQIGQGVDMIRIVLQGMFAGALLLAPVAVRGTQVVPSLGEVGAQAQRGLETDGGLLVLAVGQVNRAEVVMGFRQAGIANQRRPVGFRGFVQPARYLQGRAQIIMGLEHFGVMADRLGVGDYSRLDAAQILQGAAEIVVGLGEARLFRDGGAKPRYAVFPAASLTGDGPEEIKYLGLGRVVIDEGLVGLLRVVQASGTLIVHRPPEARVQFLGVERRRRIGHRFREKNRLCRNRAGRASAIMNTGD